MVRGLVLAPLVALTLVLSGTLCFTIAIYIDSYVTNNRVLSKHEDNLRRIAHPPNTLPVAFKSMVTRSPEMDNIVFTL